MPSTVEKVFGIPELLENILLSALSPYGAIPGKHLFVLQRVNKTFRDTIASSVELSRSMGLSSYPDIAEVPVMYCTIARELEQEGVFGLDPYGWTRGTKASDVVEIDIFLDLSWMLQKDLEDSCKSFVRTSGLEVQPRLSWHRIKLCYCNRPVKVTSYNRFTLKTFAAGEGTFGDLMHLLNDQLNRAGPAPCEMVRDRRGMVRRVNMAGKSEKQRAKVRIRTT